MFVFFNLVACYYKMWDQTKELDLRQSDMKKRTSLMYLIVMKHDIKTVGELYDYLCKKGLPCLADKL